MGATHLVRTGELQLILLGKWSYPTDELTGHGPVIIFQVTFTPVTRVPVTRRLGVVGHDPLEPTFSGALSLRRRPSVFLVLGQQDSRHGLDIQTCRL